MLCSADDAALMFLRSGGWQHATVWLVAIHGVCRSLAVVVVGEGFAAPLPGMYFSQQQCNISKMGLKGDEGYGDCHDPMQLHAAAQW